jgi:hypothetical protein
MSHPVNDELLERYYEEGFDIGASQGLAGEQLEKFAEEYAQDKFEAECY